MDWAQTAGQRGFGAIFPGANYKDDQAEADDQQDKGHDPGRAVEAFAGGSGEDGRPVFLHEGLFDEAVAIAAGDGGHEFVAHAVGVGAADVVAFEKNLVAAADAHELVAEFVEACGRIAGSHEREDGETEDAALEQAAEQRVGFHRHHLRFDSVPPRLKAMFALACAARVNLYSFPSSASSPMSRKSGETWGIPRLFLALFFQLAALSRGDGRRCPPLIQSPVTAGTACSTSLAACTRTGAGAFGI